MHEYIIIRCIDLAHNVWTALVTTLCITSMHSTPACQCQHLFTGTAVSQLFMLPCRPPLPSRTRTNLDCQLLHMSAPVLGPGLIDLRKKGWDNSGAHDARHSCQIM